MQNIPPLLQVRRGDGVEACFVVMCAGMLLTGGLFAIVLSPTIFCKAPSLISVAIWLDMTLIVCGYSAALPETSAADDLPAMFYVVIVQYMMLPLPKLWSLGLGLTNTLLQTLVAGLTAELQRENIAQQVMCKSKKKCNKA